MKKASREAENNGKVKIFVTCAVKSPFSRSKIVTYGVGGLLLSVCSAKSPFGRATGKMVLVVRWFNYDQFHLGPFRQLRPF